jgi:hypothetical protein
MREFVKDYKVSSSSWLVLYYEKRDRHLCCHSNEKIKKIFYSEAGMIISQLPPIDCGEYNI